MHVNAKKKNCRMQACMLTQKKNCRMQACMLTLQTCWSCKHVKTENMPPGHLNLAKLHSDLNIHTDTHRHTHHEMYINALIIIPYVHASWAPELGKAPLWVEVIHHPTEDREARFAVRGCLARWFRVYGQKSPTCVTYVTYELLLQRQAPICSSWMPGSLV